MRGIFLTRQAVRPDRSVRQGIMPNRVSVENQVSPVNMD